MRDMMGCQWVQGLLGAIVLTGLMSSGLAFAANLAPLQQIDLVQDRDGQTRLYLHSDQVIHHKTIRATGDELVLELEGTEAIGTIRTNYAKAPHVERVTIRPVGHDRLRIEIDGDHLGKQPIIGFREAKQIATTTKAIKTIARQQTLSKNADEKAVETTPPSIAALAIDPGNRKASPKEGLLAVSGLRLPDITQLQTALTEQLSAPVTWNTISQWGPVAGIAMVLIGLATWIGFRLRQIKVDPALNEANALVQDTASQRFKDLAARLEEVRAQESDVPPAHQQGVPDEDERGQTPIGLGALARTRKKVGTTAVAASKALSSYKQQTKPSMAAQPTTAGTERAAAGLSNGIQTSLTNKPVQPAMPTARLAKKRLTTPSQESTAPQANKGLNARRFVPPSVSSAAQRQAAKTGSSPLREALSTSKFKNSSPEALAFLQSVADHMDKQA